MIIRARALIYLDDHILLAGIEGQTTRFFPGGRIEAGERVLEGLGRELQEETQAKIVEAQYLGAIDAQWNLNGAPIHDLSHFYSVTCEGLSVLRTPVCDDDGICMEWVHQDMVKDLNLQPPVVKEWTPRWLSGDGTIWWAEV